MAKESLPFSNFKTKICIVDGCDSPKMAKSLCTKHYSGWRRGDNPTPFLAPRTLDKCSLCDRPVFSQGVCNGHFARRYTKYKGTIAPQLEGELSRFWGKVAKTDDPTQCWLWQAGRNSKGYGVVNFEGRSRRAHQVAWKLANCRDPNPDLELMHSCDNRACVNPHHLSEGTHIENMHDAQRKGRLGTPNRSHCKRGHEWNDVNSKEYIRSDGGVRRECRVCMRQNNKRFKDKRKAAKG